MSSITPTPEEQKRLEAEAARRVQQALDQIEAAQNMLASACATLSSLCYANPEYQATSRMHGRVRAHWYKVRGALQTGTKAKKVRLDALATESTLATLRSGAAK